MDATTKAFFAGEVRGANAKCFDCGQCSPQWASLTNGTYICLDCSGRHRSIGVHLSFVRCIWMDKWKPEQLAMMQAGGNQRLADFLDENGPEDWRDKAITEKYDLPACHKYRQILRTRTEAGIATAAVAEAPQPTIVAKAPPCARPQPPPKPSAFSLFDDDEPQLPKPSACAVEAQKILESMIQMQQANPSVAPKSCTSEVQKSYVPQVPKSEVPMDHQTVKCCKIDIWSDDLWD